VTEPNEQGVKLKFKTIIRSDSKYHPTIHSFNASLSLDGQDPFTYITVPEAKSEAETFVSVDQHVDFATLDAFSKYTSTVLAAETFNVHLDGKPTIKLGGLPSMKVNYNKVVTMKGSNYPLP
jgi:hypothetical protein